MSKEITIFKKLIIVFICLCNTIQVEEFEIYKEIADLCNPSLEDLQKIQQFLFQTPRPELKHLQDTSSTIRDFKFIGDSPSEIPQYYQIAVNSRDDERENCVIIYASFNQRFPKGAQRLFSLIAESDFIGHVHMRIGGWPDLTGGSIRLAHVPYAFKVCFFKEMQRKGYKRVLYLDSSIVPRVSLNQFFEIIEEKGYFIANNHVLTTFYMREETARYFGFSMAEACHLFCCQGSVIGIDLTNEITAPIIHDWYEAAKDPVAFYSRRSDQTALSLLLHQKGLTDWIPFHHNYFKIDRQFIRVIDPSLRQVD